MIPYTSMKRLIAIIGSISALVLLGASCDTNSITLDFSNTNQQFGPSLITDLQYPEWTTLSEGIDFKQQLVEVDTATELVSIVRFNPTVSPFYIAVAEGDPKTLDQWQAELDARVIINGSYFDETYNLTTRTVVEGNAYGPLLTGKTGILQNLDESDWIITKAADVPNSAPEFSVQSYPLLIHDSRMSFTEGSSDTGQRTVVAMDEQGNMYWIIAEYGVLSLKELSSLLDTELDLALAEALNLDGGSSTGLIITNQSDIAYYNSAVAVPSVLYIP